MMRYRVWDKTKKTFLNFDLHNKNWDQEYVLHTNGELYASTLLPRVLDIDLDDMQVYSHHIKPNYGKKDQTKYIIQQSMEVNDITGKEVFEGDILLTTGGLQLIRKSERYAGFCFQEYTAELNQEDGAMVFLPYLRNWLVIGHCFEDYEIIKEREGKIV